MRRAFALLATAVILCVTGCRDQANQIPPDSSQIPPGSFRVTVKDLVESDDLLVKHVIIEAPGERTVRIAGKGRVIIQPAQNADLMLGEITFVAALVKTSESGNRIKWLIQIKDQGSSMRSASTSSVEAESLADILQLKFDQESYPLGQDIVIGKFQGESIVLSVE